MGLKCGLAKKGLAGGEELELLGEESLTFKAAAEPELGCLVQGEAAVKELSPSGGYRSLMPQL